MLSNALDQFIKNKPLSVVKPGTQSRRFTHIDDTISVCLEAWKKNLCRHYSVSNKKSFKQYYEILNGDIVVDAEGLYVVNSNFAFGDEPIHINSNIIFIIRCFN